MAITPDNREPDSDPVGERAPVREVLSSMIEGCPHPMFVVSGSGEIMGQNPAMQASLIIHLGDLRELIHGMVSEIRDTNSTNCSQDSILVNVENRCIVFDFYMWRVKLPDSDGEFYTVQCIDVTESCLDRGILYTLWHDIRNEITVILNGFDLGFEMEEIKKRVKEAVGRLKAIIEEGLDLRRSQRNGVKYEPIQVIDTTKKLVASYKYKLGKRVVNIDNLELLVKVFGDSALLSHLMRNLLDNAIKNTKNGETIDIRIFENNDMVRIQFSNPGDSIPPEILEHIFEPFHESGSSNSFGLGMHIVYICATLMGGQVGVDRDDENGLNVFWVDLPRAE